MAKFLLTVFKILTVLLALGYLISCLTPYVSPVKIPWLAFAALGFAYLAVALLILIVIWLPLDKRGALALVVVLLLGYKNLSSTFALNIFSRPAATEVRNKNSMRIMGWNVRDFDNPSSFSDTPGSVRQRMLKYILEKNPDILCMQDFADDEGPGMISNMTALTECGYIYHYSLGEFIHNYKPYYVFAGSAIFSKVPIVDSGKAAYNDPTSPEFVAYVDVLHQGKRLRVYVTHFKSLNLYAKMVIEPADKILFHGDSTFVYTASKSEKIMVFAKEHVTESSIAKAVMDKSPYPFVLSGDLNSVPASYPYHVMAEGLQDAFLEKGLGLGKTFDKDIPSLRIDYLLADKRIQIKNYGQDNLSLSDHYPHYIDIDW